MKLNPDKPILVFGIVITILAYLCFSIAAAFVRSFDISFSTFEILFFQNLISFILILPFFIKKKLYHVSVKLLPLHVCRSVAGLGSFFCYFLAIKQINLIDASVLAYTAPFYTPILWVLLTKEKMEKGIWWTIILGFIGIGLILKPTNAIIKAGSFIGLSSGILGSVALVSIKKLNLKMESMIRTLFFYFLISALITLPITIFYWKTPSNIEIFFIIGVGFSMALGQLLLTVGYKHGTASFLSPLSYTAIVFTSLISWIIFKQSPGFLSFIGALLIITGGSISYIIKIKPTKFIEIFEHPEDEKIHFWQKIQLHHHHIQIHKHKKNIDKK